MSKEYIPYEHGQLTTNQLENEIGTLRQQLQSSNRLAYNHDKKLNELQTKVARLENDNRLHSIEIDRLTQLLEAMQTSNLVMQKTVEALIAAVYSLGIDVT